MSGTSDTIYTERYMSLLSENVANYKNASLLAHAEKIRNKKYMIIHGTFDDNVHYQQSMMLSYELERRVILFRQQVSIVKTTTVQNSLFFGKGNKWKMYIVVVDQNLCRHTLWRLIEIPVGLFRASWIG